MITYGEADLPSEELTLWDINHVREVTEECPELIFSGIVFEPTHTTGEYEMVKYDGVLSAVLYAGLNSKLTIQPMQRSVLLEPGISSEELYEDEWVYDADKAGIEEVWLPTVCPSIELDIPFAHIDSYELHD